MSIVQPSLLDHRALILEKILGAESVSVRALMEQ